MKPDEVICITRLDARVKWHCDECLPNKNANADHLSLKKLASIQKHSTSLEEKIEVFQNKTVEGVTEIERSWAEIVSPGELSKNIKSIRQCSSTAQVSSP